MLKTKKLNHVPYGFLIEKAEFSERLEFPLIHQTKSVPNRLIPFSKAVQKGFKDFDCWVCFYESDAANERLWKNPRRYLKRLCKFRGVISPDFSLPLEGTLPVLLSQIHRGRSLGAWLEQNGLPVIANVRSSNDISKSFCCEGVPQGASIAIGTLGCLRNPEKRRAIIDTVDLAISALLPKMIVIYGGCPPEISTKCRRNGIELKIFPSETTIRREESKRKRRAQQRKLIEQRQGRFF